MGFSSLYAGSFERVLADERAMKHAVKAALVKQLGRIKSVFLLWRVDGFLNPKLNPQILQSCRTSVCLGSPHGVVSR
jgi:hypothetical protein